MNNWFNEWIYEELIRSEYNFGSANSTVWWLNERMKGWKDERMKGWMNEYNLNE